MSTPTAATLPDVSGATSVCSFAARLPVASKYCGNSRDTAAVVVTSTTGGVGLADAAALVCPLERLHAEKTLADATATAKIKISFRRCERVIVSIAFSLDLLFGSHLASSSAGQ